MKIGFLMDAIEKIHPEKDSSIILMAEAHARNYDVYYFEQKDLWMENGEVFATMKKLSSWFHVESCVTLPLQILDIILMRKDPPVDVDYLNTTLLLELAEKSHPLNKNKRKHTVKVINNPQALRDINEKLFISWFPQCCAPTLVTLESQKIKAFLKKHRDIVLKPLNNMGGRGIFRLTSSDFNINVILETMTQYNTVRIMAQKYIPAIQKGDKRIMMMHGKPLPYAISRLPKEGETRANLAAGGSYQKAKLTQRDNWICNQVGPVLKQKGVLFAGLDIIGPYLTEINITSPTCLKEIDTAFNINSARYFFDGLYL